MSCPSNCKLTDSLRLILAPVTTSYLPISLPTSTTSALLVTSMLTSSAYAVYQATSVETVNVRPRRWGFVLNLRRDSSSSRTNSMDDNRQPWRIDWVQMKCFDLTRSLPPSLRGTHREGESSCESEARNRPQTAASRKAWSTLPKVLGWF